MRRPPNPAAIGVLFGGALVALFSLFVAFSPQALADHGGPITFVDIKNPPSEDEDCDYHFRTLKAALARCPLQEFSTIIVDPGIYDEGELEVSIKGLIIKSSGGAQRTKIKGCFAINAKKVQLQGFDIHAAACDTGVAVANREVELHGLIIHEAKSDGIQIGGGSDGTVIANNRLFNNSRYGIHALGGSYNLQITQSRVESNGSSGILLEGNSNRFTISENEAVLNLGAGLLVLNSDGGQITNNTFTANKLEGVKLDKSNGHVIVGNTVTSNGLFGISLVGSDNNEVRGNEVMSNRAGGVALRGNGEQTQRSTVESNQILNHSQTGSSGVLLEGDVIGSIILKNTISGNSIGVRLTRSEQTEGEPSNNTIDSNDVRDSDMDGIRVEASFGLNLFRSNQITDNNGVGLYILGGRGNDEIADNLIQGNGHEGVRIEGSARNAVHDNEITGNGGGDGSGDVNDGGSIVLLKTQNTTVRGNRLHDGEPNGILLMETQNTRILENTVERHQQDGIKGSEVTGLFLEGNTIRMNRERGIALRACADLDMQRNVVTDNTLGGVFTADCDGVHVQMNEITDNLRYGLWVEGSRDIEARRNWWGDPSGPAGIFAGRGNAVIFVNNDVQGGNSTPLAQDAILQAVVPWLTDRVGEQIEGSVMGFLFTDFGPDKVEADAMTPTDARLALFNVDKEERGIAILSRYATPLPGENSFYQPVGELPNAIKTISVVTSGFSSGRAVIDVAYRDDELPEGVNRANLRLFYWDGSQWTVLPGKSLQNVNLVEGEIDVTLLRRGALVALAPQAQ